MRQPELRAPPAPRGPLAVPRPVAFDAVLVGTVGNEDGWVYHVGGEAGRAMHRRRADPTALRAVPVLGNGNCAFHATGQVAAHFGQCEPLAAPAERKAHARWLRAMADAVESGECQWLVRALECLQQKGLTLEGDTDDEDDDDDARAAAAAARAGRRAEHYRLGPRAQTAALLRARAHTFGPRGPQPGAGAQPLADLADIMLLGVRRGLHYTVYQVGGAAFGPHWVALAATLAAAQEEAAAWREEAAVIAAALRGDGDWAAAEGALAPPAPHRMPIPVLRYGDYVSALGPGFANCLHDGGELLLAPHRLDGSEVDATIPQQEPGHFTPLLRGYCLQTLEQVQVRAAAVARLGGFRARSDMNEEDAAAYMASDEEMAPAAEEAYQEELAAEVDEEEAAAAIAAVEALQEVDGDVPQAGAQCVVCQEGKWRPGQELVALECACAGRWMHRHCYERYVAVNAETPVYRLDPTGCYVNEPRPLTELCPCCHGSAVVRHRWVVPQAPPENEDEAEAPPPKRRKKKQYR